MKKQKKWFMVLNIVIPLSVGIVLYYFMSPETIFVKCIDKITGVTVRGNTITLHSGLLRIVRFYVPDMCWAYALTFSLHTVLDNNMATLKQTFLIAFIFSAFMEILQLTPFVKGTFDFLDILCELMAVGFAVCIIKYAHEEAKE